VSSKNRSCVKEKHSRWKNSCIRASSHVTKDCNGFPRNVYVLSLSSCDILRITKCLVQGVPLAVKFCLPIKKNLAVVEYVSS
jgi:hypothetical protein